MKTPKNRQDEEDELPVDTLAQEVAESLPGYQEYQKEARGDSLNFGDY
jgi:hypothetical protein